MFSYLFPAKPVETRFKKKIETRQIIEFMTELKNKEYELKKSSENLGPGSIDYAKYIILNQLNKNLNNAIQAFNDTPLPDDEVKETQEFINLLRTFIENLAVITTNHGEQLNQHRRQALISKSMMKILFMGGVGATFFVSGFVAGVGMIFLSDGVDTLLHSTNLFHEQETATSKLLTNFMTHLNNIIKNLVLLINLKQLKTPPNLLSDEDNMTCPITAEVMMDPYLCILDGYSYEKSAIVRCLTDSRKSPMTRKEMAPDDKIENVIIENRALKNIIINYQMYRQKELESKTLELKKT